MQDKQSNNNVPSGQAVVLPDTLQRVLPRTIPGPPIEHNKGALEW